jgi:hypothetical protein
LTSFDLIAPMSVIPSFSGSTPIRDVVYRTWRLSANRFHAAQQKDAEDPEARELWQTFNRWSTKELQSVNQRPLSGQLTSLSTL